MNRTAGLYLPCDQLCQAVLVRHRGRGAGGWRSSRRRGSRRASHVAIGARRAAAPRREQASSQRRGAECSAPAGRASGTGGRPSPPEKQGERLDVAGARASFLTLSLPHIPLPFAAMSARLLVQSALRAPRPAALRAAALPRAFASHATRQVSMRSGPDEQRRLQRRTSQCHSADVRRTKESASVQAVPQLAAMLLSAHGLLSRPPLSCPCAGRHEADALRLAPAHHADDDARQRPHRRHRVEPGGADGHRRRLDRRRQPRRDGPHQRHGPLP